MRWNEQEVVGLLSTKTPDWEGQLTYKPPKSGAYKMQTAFKERYFKVVGNLLFCLRVSSASSVFHTAGDKVVGGDVVSVMVLEHFTVQVIIRTIYILNLLPSLYSPGLDSPGIGEKILNIVGNQAQITG